VLSYDAIADNVSPEQVIQALLKQFPAEQVEIRD
jgi:hypothetical protein